MAILSDVRILEKLYEKDISIDPFIYDHIQPASIDLTLNDTIRVLNEPIIQAFDIKKEHYAAQKIKKHILKPGDFILAEIRETISIGKSYTARIENRNSLARLGIDISMGSYINPGYSGRMTIAIKNNSNSSIEICKGMRICQLVIEDVSPAPSYDYGIKPDAKYQNEKGVVIPRLFEDREYQEFLNKNSIDKAESLEKLGDFMEERLKEKAQSLSDILSKQDMRELGIK